MRFRQYINEARNGVFAKVKLNKSLIQNKKKFTIIEVGKLSDFESWSIGKNIIKSKPFRKPKYYTKIVDNKGVESYLVSGAEKSAPKAFNMSWADSPTGRLKIETSQVVQSHKVTQYELPTMTFPAYVFDSINDIIRAVNTGFRNIKGMPDYIADTIQSNMVAPYHNFDWGVIDNTTERNEIGIYFGEILVTMSLLNNEMGAFSGDRMIPSGEHVTKVIFPKDTSFKAVDSIIETDKGTVVKISSKKGKGASASLYGNVISHIIKHNIDVSGTVLNELVHSANGFNLKINVLSPMYIWGFAELDIFRGINMEPTHFKAELVSYKKTGESGYKEQFDIVSDRIRSRTWSHFQNKKLDNLPFSISHFISGAMTEKLNNDKASMRKILRILGEENYYQVSLHPSFTKTGKAKYTVKHSGSNKVRIVTSRATYGDPSLSQAKVNYEIY